MSPQILNPEFIVQTLNAEIFKSREFCRVSDFLPNPDIFSACVVYVTVYERPQWLTLPMSSHKIGGRCLPQSITGTDNQLYNG